MAETEDQSSSSAPEPRSTATYDFIIEGKGVEIVAVGTTCLVERLADGNIIKTPYLSHHHDTAAELATEARIYQLIGPHPLLVPVVSWDESTHALTLGFMSNGTLKDYIPAHPYASTTQRLLWARQAAEALQLVHAVGMVHYDVGPHNFLLDDQRTLRISDFGGSSVDGSRPEISAGTRYAPADEEWCRGWRPSPAGDVFGLGSTLYYISTGNAPFHDIESDEVDKRFAARVFPAVGDVLAGDVILKCWMGGFTSASEVLSVLGTLYGNGLDGEKSTGAWVMRVLLSPCGSRTLVEPMTYHVLCIC